MKKLKFFFVKFKLTNLTGNEILCMLCMRIEIYRGIYREGYILFVYNSASVPWINSVTNFRFFTNISETVLPTNMYYISLKRSFYSTSARVCCIKVHAEMNEILQVKDFSFSSPLPMLFDSNFHILSLNIHVI